jgi:hypothetical protein
MVRFDVTTADEMDLIVADGTCACPLVKVAKDAKDFLSSGDKTLADRDDNIEDANMLSVEVKLN